MEREDWNVPVPQTPADPAFARRLATLARASVPVAARVVRPRWIAGLAALGALLALTGAGAAAAYLGSDHRHHQATGVRPTPTPSAVAPVPGTPAPSGISLGNDSRPTPAAQAPTSGTARVTERAEDTPAEDTPAEDTPAEHDHGQESESSPGKNRRTENAHETHGPGRHPSEDSSVDPSDRREQGDSDTP